MMKSYVEKKKNIIKSDPHYSSSIEILDLK